MFFAKGSPTKDIWYFEHPYPPGAKSYNKTKPINIKEFDLEKAWWNNREENKYAWKVSIQEIKKRGYNLDINNPKVSSEEVTKSSLEILEELHTSQHKVQQMIHEIKSLLSQ